MTGLSLLRFLINQISHTNVKTGINIQYINHTTVMFYNTYIVQQLFVKYVKKRKFIYIKHFLTRFRTAVLI